MPGEKDVKKMLGQKIQEEALKTYLYSHTAFYTTISLSYLADTFDLPQSNVAALVSSMIWNEQLSASLDSKSEMLVLHRETRSPLQQMAIALADKIGQMLNENERTANAKMGDADQSREQRGGDRREQQQDGQRRGGERRTRGTGGRGRGRGSNFQSSSMGRAY